MLNQANKAVLDALVALHANMLAQDLDNQAERPTEEEFQACMAAASAAIRAATEEGAPAPADPMDWPLPCDVVIGHITMRKGLKLSALVKPMQVLYEMTEGASLAAQAELAVAVPSDDMVLAAARVLSPNLFRHGLHPLPKDGKYTAMMTRVEAERARAMLTAALAAAPQPQAPAQEPFGYVNTNTGQFFADVEECRKGNEGHWRTVYVEPAPAAQGGAVLAYLDGLSDDAAAHIFPDDLRRCSTSECTATVYSVRVGSPDGKTVPLYSREQVAAAIAAQKGRAA